MPLEPAFLHAVPSVALFLCIYPRNNQSVHSGTVNETEKRSRDFCFLLWSSLQVKESLCITLSVVSQVV